MHSLRWEAYAVKIKFFVLPLILVASVAQAQSGSWQMFQTRGCAPFSPTPCSTDVFRIDSTGAFSHSNGGSGKLTSDELSALNGVVQPFLGGAISPTPSQPVCTSFNGGPNRYAPGYRFYLGALTPAVTVEGALIYSQDAYAICAQNSNYNGGSALFAQVETLYGAHPATGTTPPASSSPSPTP